jgi:hypothetical protein
MHADYHFISVKIGNKGTGFKAMLREVVMDVAAEYCSSELKKRAFLSCRVANSALRG